MKYLTIFLAFVFLISFVTAEQQTLGTFKVGKSINLLQTCSNCTYVNVSYVQAPNSTIILSNKLMTKSGASYNYTLQPQQELGVYVVCGFGDLDGATTTWCYNLEVTVDGYSSSKFPIVLLLPIGGIILLFLGRVLQINSLFIMGGVFIIVFGVLTLYPGYGYVNYNSLLGLTIGTCCIGIGFLMMLLPSFKKDEYVEVEEYED